MWTAKFKLNHKDCPVVQRTKKFGIDVFTYPNEHYFIEEEHRTSGWAKFVQEDKNNAAFLEDLKQDERIVNLDVQGNSFFIEWNLGEKGEAAMLYYDKKMSMLKPTLNSQDEHEYYEVACEDKQVIKDFFDNLTGHMDKAEVVYIKKQNFGELFFPNGTDKPVLVNFSENQQKAFSLALKHNYYSFPRKVDLAFLAKKMGISLSTYQEHLRKAEEKFFSQFKEEK